MHYCKLHIIQIVPYVGIVATIVLTNQVCWWLFHFQCPDWSSPLVNWKKCRNRPYLRYIDYIHIRYGFSFTIIGRIFQSVTDYLSKTFETTLHKHNRRALTGSVSHKKSMQGTLVALFDWYHGFRQWRMRLIPVNFDLTPMIAKYRTIYPSECRQIKIDYATPYMTSLPAKR